MFASRPVTVYSVTDPARVNVCATSPAPFSTCRVKPVNADSPPSDDGSSHCTSKALCPPVAAEGLWAVGFAGLDGTSESVMIVAEEADQEPGP